MNISLSWRVEEACTNAWPALRESEYAGWRVRISVGTSSRRINSANPLSKTARLASAERAAIEATFRAGATTPVFRVPTFLGPEVNTELTRAGYSTEGETCTLFAKLQDRRPARDADITISETQDPHWIAGLAALQTRIGKQSDAMAEIFTRLKTPCIFAGAWRDGQMVSAAFGARHDDLVCIEAVVTDPAWRRRGLARRVVSAILDMSEARGAAGACLQVEAANTHAIALYRGLGFDTELYRYHYRRAPKHN